jgi:hypothetical protein
MIFIKSSWFVFTRLRSCLFPEWTSESNKTTTLIEDEEKVGGRAGVTLATPQPVLIVPHDQLTTVPSSLPPIFAMVR